MTALIRYEAACLALAEWKAVDVVKSWADQAAAMQTCGRMVKDKALEIDAAEIRIRAERRLGELIDVRKDAEGLSKGGRPLKEAGSSKELVLVSTLAELGIDKKLPSRAQEVAALSQATFEMEMAAIVASAQDWDKAQSVGRPEKPGNVAGFSTVAQRAAQSGAGERTQRMADKVAKADPALAQQVAHGEITLPTAVKKITAKQPAAKPTPTKTPPSAPPPEDAPVAAELLEDLQAHVESLTALIKAAEADDAKAEAIKWRRAYNNASRNQGELMDRAARSDNRERSVMRQLRRCGEPWFRTTRPRSPRPSRPSCASTGRRSSEMTFILERRWQPSFGVVGEQIRVGRHLASTNATTGRGMTALIHAPLGVLQHLDTTTEASQVRAQRYLQNATSDARNHFELDSMDLSDHSGTLQERSSEADPHGCLEMRIEDRGHQTAVDAGAPLASARQFQGDRM